MFNKHNLRLHSRQIRTVYSIDTARRSFRKVDIQFAHPPPVEIREEVIKTDKIHRK